MIKDLKHVSNYSLTKLVEDMEKIEKAELLSSNFDLNQAIETYPTYFKYVMQLSLYRWLRDNPEDSTDGAILFSLNNGSGFKGLPVDTEVFLPLITGEKLESWIRERINLIKQHLKDGTFPECTDVERLQKKGTWKLTRYSQKTGKFRTVNGTTSDTQSGFDALTAGKIRPGDEIVVVPPKYLGCEWCKYSEVCEQFNR